MNNIQQSVDLIRLGGIILNGNDICAVICLLILIVVGGIKAVYRIRRRIFIKKLRSVLGNNYIVKFKFEKDFMFKTIYVYNRYKQVLLKIPAYTHQENMEDYSKNIRAILEYKESNHLKTVYEIIRKVKWEQIEEYLIDDICTYCDNSNNYDDYHDCIYYGNCDCENCHRDNCDDCNCDDSMGLIRLYKKDYDELMSVNKDDTINKTIYYDGINLYSKRKEIKKSTTLSEIVSSKYICHKIFMTEETEIIELILKIMIVHTLDIDKIRERLNESL